MIAAVIANLLEILSFLIGLYYYRKYPSRPTYYLVLFLGLTVSVELAGWYAILMKFGYLTFLEGTPFQKNFWLYNIYGVVSYLFYINYFKWFLTSVRSIAILNIASIVFLVVAAIETLFFPGFFETFLPIYRIFGTLLVLMSIAIYYLELLKSDQILQVHKSLPFYISVGALMFHLCTTPLFIYVSYFNYSIDPGFAVLYRQVIFGTNYFLYSIYIAGFLICSQTKTPYSLKKNF